LQRNSERKLGHAETKQQQEPVKKSQKEVKDVRKRRENKERKKSNRKKVVTNTSYKHGLKNRSIFTIFNKTSLWITGKLFKPSNNRKK
jgi:hypothetical protein